MSAGAGYASWADLRELSERVEGVSAGYARRFGIERTGAWRMLKLQEELGELTQAYLKMTGQARGGDSADVLQARFAAQLADVLCHVLLVAGHHRVDIEAAIAEKWMRWENGPARTGA